MFKEIDILRHEEGYALEPSIEYDEIETLIVARGDIFYIEADLWLDDENYVSAKQVVRVE